MFFDKFCVLILCICAVSAHTLNKNEFPSAESDLDYVLARNDFGIIHSQSAVEACHSDDDCHNGGACVTTSDIQKCSCKNGTSGAFCETVDECETLPRKCGNDTDAKCVFSLKTEIAECKCDSAHKMFDEKIQKCRVPCRNKSDCEDTWCSKESEADPFGFCSCDWGRAGDQCEETIDECKKAGIDCGEDPNVTCSYVTRGVLYPKDSYCKCPLWYHGYDYDAKVCKDCDCGPRTSCTFQSGGIKKCDCDMRYYESEGKCRRCNCGENAISCKLEEGRKVCSCGFMYQDNGYGVCLECNCGPNADCLFNKGTKVCTCRDGYIKAPDGICRERCSQDNPCSNGGECVSNLCQCIPGTKGEKCEIVEPCTSTWKTWEVCGSASGVECAFNQTTRTHYCACSQENKSYDTKTKECRDKCEEDSNCTNGGVCVNELCQCLPGTKGGKCEIIEKCITESDVRELCNDYLARCKYNQTTHSAYCTCILPEEYSYDTKASKCKAKLGTSISPPISGKTSSSVPGSTHTGAAGKLGTSISPPVSGKTSSSVPSSTHAGITGSGISSTQESSTKSPLLQETTDHSSWRTGCIILGLLLGTCLIGLGFTVFKLRSRRNGNIQV